jgi:hypothetical protein
MVLRRRKCDVGAAPQLRRRSRPKGRPIICIIGCGRIQLLLLRGARRATAQCLFFISCIIYTPSMLDLTRHLIRPRADGSWLRRLRRSAKRPLSRQARLGTGVVVEAFAPRSTACWHGFRPRPRSREWARSSRPRPGVGTTLCGYAAGACTLLTTTPCRCDSMCVARRARHNTTCAPRGAGRASPPDRMACRRRFGFYRLAYPSLRRSRRFGETTPNASERGRCCVPGLAQAHPHDILS